MKLSHNLSVNAKCLTNSPSYTFESLYKGLPFPGQCYSLNQQCQYLKGPQSIYCDGVSLYFNKKWASRSLHRIF